MADQEIDKRMLGAIMEALPQGVLVADARGRVRFINPAFKHLIELQDDMGTDGPVEDYFKDAELCRWMRRIVKDCRSQSPQPAEYEFTLGSDKFLLARAQPVGEILGACQGAVITVVDITAVKVLDRLKSEFVAKVSHELRSPLSTIHEQLAAVINDVVDQVSPSNVHMLSRAREKTQGLISLIGDLMDLSRIEAGVVCQESKPVDIIDLLENIIDFLSVRASARQQRIKLTPSKQRLAAVLADPLALESIFGNLITNAINYSPEASEIEVKIQEAGPHIRVQVIDNGYGIKARHLDKIFERFYRVKNEKTRYITGTGLGLPIVKGLVDSLGGQIKVESEPDQGSIFTVELPATSP